MIHKQIDLKEDGRYEFSQKEIEDLIVKDLDVFNLQTSKESDKKGENSEEKLDGSKVSTARSLRLNNTQKEVLEYTLDYIMNEMDYITVDELLSEKVLGKPFHFSYLF